MSRDIWIFLFALGILLFNWPLMSIFRYGISKYLFLAWFIFIALIFIATLNKRNGKNGG
jgi:hypothetical protein